MSENLGYSLDLPWFKPVPWLDMANGAEDWEHGGMKGKLSSCTADAGNMSLTSPSKKIPSDEECAVLWDIHYTMEHIKAHCRRVADFAEALALRAVELFGTEDAPKAYKGHPPCPNNLAAITRAAGLLHDVAKSFCIRNGGSHAQIGASWVKEATGNYRIAQAVLHHVEWPWARPSNICSAAIFVGYADKRVKHDTYVTLEERYEDLLTRYAKNDPLRYTSICATKERALNLERALSEQLELPLHACTFNCGRLVARA